MARITVDDCLENIPNRFELTLVAAYRARQVANGSEVLVQTASHKDKPTVLALREIAAGKIGKEILNRKSTVTASVEPAVPTEEAANAAVEASLNPEAPAA